MRKSMTRRGDEGMAMLVGMVFVAMALMITGAISTQLISQKRQVDVYQEVNATYQALDNANDLARIDVDNGGTGIFGLPSWTPVYDESTGLVLLPALNASGVAPLEMEVMSESGVAMKARFIVYTRNWDTDMRDTNGDGTNNDPNDVLENGLYTVYAKAEVLAPTATSVARVREMKTPIQGHEMKLASATHFPPYTHDKAPQARDMQMASAPFDVKGLADTVQFTQVRDAALSSYAALPVLLSGVPKAVSIVRQTEVIHQATEISVWGNAIFAGDGQIGATINGNVSVCGGVHILGERMLNGMIAITSPDDPSMEISGTSFIHNNYHVGAGTAPPQRMWDAIPPLPTKLVGGKNVSTLNANLRVKHGTVDLQGNAEIGEPNDPDNNEKEFMDGTYVTDGFNDPQNHVYSDNGKTNAYDLGNKLGFPKLDDEYFDPTTKQPYTDSTNPGRPNGHYTHQDYFTEVLVGDPNLPNDGILEGNLTLTAGDCGETFVPANPADKPIAEGVQNGTYYKVSKEVGLDSPVDSPYQMANEVNGIQFGNIADASLSGTGAVAIMPTLIQGQGGGGPGGGGPCEGFFYYNARTHKMYKGIDPATIPPADLPVNDTAIDSHDGDDYIWWDPSTNKLQMNGNVAIKGNLTITGPNGATVDYSGRAALMVIDGTDPGLEDVTKGNVSIQVDLLARNEDGTIDKTTFPIKNALGFMADTNLALGTGAHRNIMGPFYAEKTVSMDKQSQVFGTIVGEDFNIGNQVPNIYQIPALQQFLPFGMIGEIPILALSQRSWREIPVD